MKRILVCSFVVLSFFGLMVFARGGGGGRGHMGGGVGHSGGAVSHMGGGAGRGIGHAGAAGAGSHTFGGHRGPSNHNHENNHGNGWHNGNRSNNGAYGYGLGAGLGLGLLGGAPFWTAGYTYRSYCNKYPDDEKCYRY